jgi:phage-related protein
MLEEPFLANRNINESMIKGKTKPYFMGLTYNPLILTLSFGFTEPWNDELIREIVQTFMVDYYKPLWFEDGEDQIFYCMPVSEAYLIHNSLQEGYANIQFRCNDIYAYSRLKNTQFTDFTSDIRFSNRGDVPIFPVMEFVVEGEYGVDPPVNVSITNNKNGNVMLFTELDPDEHIIINNETESIISEHPQYYSRYNKHNDVFLKMETGSNLLTVSGIKELTFEWQFKTLPG